MATFFVSLGIAFYLFVIMGFFGDMPSRRELQNKRNDTASEVYSADSVLLGRYFIYDRTNIAYRDIDTTVIEALVATEDARFYQHHGVDSRSLARVVVKSILLQKESSGGGSTLTQQLIKKPLPTPGLLDSGYANQQGAGDDSGPATGIGLHQAGNSGTVPEYRLFWRHDFRRRAGGQVFFSIPRPKISNPSRLPRWSEC